MDDYIDLPEAIEHEVLEVYKYDSASTPKRIIRLYQISHDADIGKNKENDREENKPV